jgi:hypothetical protein
MLFNRNIIWATYFKRYWMDLAKGNILEKSLSDFFLKIGHYLAFWCHNNIWNSESIRFIDMHTLKWSELQIFSSWCNTILQWFLEISDKKLVTKKDVISYEFFNKTHIDDIISGRISSSDINLFQTTAYLFLKWQWTIDTFKSNWVYDFIKSNSSYNSISKLKLLNLFIKWKEGV